MSRDRKYSIQLVVEGNEEEYFLKLQKQRVYLGRFLYQLKMLAGLEILLHIISHILVMMKLMLCLLFMMQITVKMKKIPHLEQ